MNSKQIRQMVTTAIIIALTVVFQYLRPVLGGTNPVSTYIIGALVNLSLIVAACVVGLWSGVAVAVVAPLIALAQGHAQIFMVPWIIVGNASLAIAYALFARKSLGKSAADWTRFCVVGVIAAIVKYVIIALGQTVMMTSQKGAPLAAAASTAFVAQIQQPVTSLIAMVLGKLVILALPASVKQ